MTSKRTTRRGSERRRDPRADARLSMRVEGAPDDGDHAHIVTESQNISASGIYCYASHYLAPLSKVALTIVLPHMPGGSGSQELIKCEGIVVRCEGGPARKGEEQFELACMFSDMDEERRFQIEEFVTWRNLQALRAAATASGAKASRSKTKAAASRKKASAKAKRKSTVTRSSTKRPSSGGRKKVARAARSVASTTGRTGAKRAVAKSARKTVSRRTVH